MNHSALKWFTVQIAEGYSQTEIQELDRNLKIVPLGEVLPLDHPDGRKFLESLIEEYKPDGIVLDSMGKVSNKSLSDEEKIKQLNAYYGNIRNKYEVFLWFIHHNRKANGENKKPTALDDIYGNQYIAAETSAALNLWKEKDGSLELSAIKLRLAPELKPFEVKRGEHLKFSIVEKEQPSFDGIVSEITNDTKPNPEPPKSNEPKDRGVFDF
jgi:hypothetical protein